MRLEAVEFDPLPDIRWLDADDSGETREAGGVECEQVRQAVRFHQGNQPRVMGLLNVFTPQRGAL